MLVTESWESQRVKADIASLTAVSPMPNRVSSSWDLALPTRLTKILLQAVPSDGRTEMAVTKPWGV